MWPGPPRSLQSAEHPHLTSWHQSRSLSKREETTEGGREGEEGRGRK